MTRVLKTHRKLTGVLNKNSISSLNDTLSPFFTKKKYEARTGSIPHPPMHPHTNNEGYTVGHYVPLGGQHWDVNAKSGDQEVDVREPGKDLQCLQGQGPAVAAGARYRGHQLVEAAGRPGPPEVPTTALHLGEERGVRRGRGTLVPECM